MQTVLITGTEGFAGSNFFHDTQSRMRSERVRLIPHTKSVMGVSGDLASAEVTLKILRAVKPDIIIHLAGRVPSSRRIIKDSDFNRDNVETTRNLVNAAKSLKKLPHIILPSTAGVYPSGGIIEDFKTVSRRVIYARTTDTLNREHIPSSYAKSKLDAEGVIKGYSGPWTILRKPTVIGPNDLRGNFLQLLAFHILKDREVSVSSLDRCADYIGITEVSNATWAAANNPKAHGHILNIGSGHPTTGHDALSMMLKTGNLRGIDIGHFSPCPKSEGRGNYQGTVLDIKEAQNLIGYEPKSTLDDLCGIVWDDILHRPCPQKHLGVIFPKF